MTDKDTKRDHEHLDAYDKPSIDRDNTWCTEIMPGSKSTNTLKRSAMSPVEGSMVDDGAIKRPRQGIASSVYETGERSAVDSNPSSARTLKENQVDAATETGIAGTISAKLALLRDEEIAAKEKHEAEMAMAQAKYEADVARRRQVMAELEYESKMSALRQLSELSTGKRSTTPAPAVTGSSSLGNPEPPRLRTSTGTSAANASSTGDKRRQTVDTNTKVQEAPKSLSPGKQQLPKSDTTAITQPKKLESTSARNKMPDTSSQTNGPVKRTTAPDTTKAAIKPSSPPTHRPTSSRSRSIVIKTSLSPPPRAPTGPQAHAPRTPIAGVKHLTCYFWKHTGCSKSAAECNYAHYDTGVTATDPQDLRRFRRSGRADIYTPR
ncbi:MAG: hypothetical protein Q9166_007205 [cf. Caloplaca sp. 2 TL-2023]